MIFFLISRAKPRRLRYVVVVCCDIKPTTRFAAILLSGIAQLALPRSLKMKSARFEKASQEIRNHEGRKASATAQPLTDGRTDDNLFRFRASVYPW